MPRPLIAAVVLASLLLGACGETVDEAGGLIRITNSTTCEFTCGRTWIDGTLAEDLCGTSPFLPGETRDTDTFTLGTTVRIELYVPSGCMREFEVVIDADVVPVNLT